MEQEYLFICLCFMSVEAMWPAASSSLSWWIMSHGNKTHNRLFLTTITFARFFDHHSSDKFYLYTCHFQWLISFPYLGHIHRTTELLRHRQLSWRRLFRVIMELGHSLSVKLCYVFWILVSNWLQAGRVGSINHWCLSAKMSQGSMNSAYIQRLSFLTNMFINFM